MCLLKKLHASEEIQQLSDVICDPWAEHVNKLRDISQCSIFVLADSLGYSGQKDRIINVMPSHVTTVILLFHVYTWYCDDL